MRRLLFLTAVAMMVFNACHQKSHLDKNPVPVTESKGVAVKLADLTSDKDFVCGMPLEEGNIADTTSYEGKLYGFCSVECKTAFLKNPKNYLSQP